MKCVFLVNQEGAAAKAIQTTPHTVLISDDFYHSKLKPLMAKWLMLFLSSNGVNIAGQQEEVRGKKSRFHSLFEKSSLLHLQHS